jgi:predicted transcriptional regulator
MPTNGEPSLGELSRQLSSLLTKLEAMESKFISREAHDLDEARYRLIIQNVQEQVKELKDTNTWMIRLVLGLILTTIILGLITRG